MRLHVVANISSYSSDEQVPMNKFELHLTGCDEYTFSLACFWTKVS